ncbi:MAG: cadmium-translocating P-type ATPase [Promethearchaeota archaeon]|nr:MAG: cadmium-translocating P-type ATPase [Candidatus Lokiarchaeota archaeon]
MNQQKQQEKENNGKDQKGMSHHKKMVKDFRRRFIVSLILTVPVLVFSPTIQGWLNYSIVFSGMKYVTLTIASLIFVYGGWPFLKGLVNEIKKKSPGMMTLIALAIAVAYFYSFAVVVGLTGKYFFWELVTLIDIMLLGHWIEMRSVMGASRALEELVQLLPSEAHLITNGDIEEIPIEDLQKGDKALVKPSEQIPSDGVILKGRSFVDVSMITGESQPVEKEEGEEVIGGSINGDGTLTIEIQKTGEESYLNKVIELVKTAQKNKSKTQKLADRAAFWLTIISISTGLITFLAWYFVSYDVSYSIERMATVMVITCPHALGLAIPLVVAVSTSLSAKNGLLIRNRTAFENSRKITTVIFDKTGTLTKGEFAVSSIRSYNEKFSEEEIIRYAASLERYSEHPIATGIVKKAEEQELEYLEVEDFQAIKGKGIEGTIEGKAVKVVSKSYLEEKGITIPENYQEVKAETLVNLLVENELVGTIGLGDQIREESYPAIERLQKAGIKCWMLTGDTEAVAKEVAEKLKMEGYFAEVLPHEKQEKIIELQEEGEFVAMTGDGVNDAPALAQADVGIAVGSGTDVAAETADIILVNSNPEDVTQLILFGKATYRKMIQNLFWATGYNAIAIPLAAGALAFVNFIISPAIGAILMSLSTVIVAINARLLKIDQELSAEEEEEKEEIKNS